MKVFISWSGKQSGEVAVALHDWLPQVIHVLDPFVSSKDISAGSQWQSEIASRLESTFFGIVCVTKANQGAPWLNFEAGALAKTIEASKVVPLAIDLKPSDIELPLAQFQAQPATEEGITETVAALNQACEMPLENKRLEKAIAMWWPELEQQLKAITKRVEDQDSKPKPKRRSDRELIEETLDTVRTLARRAPGSSRDSTSTSVSEENGPAVLPLDHPLLAELEEIAGRCDEGRDALVVRSRLDRKIGVLPSKNLPDAVRDEMIEQARVYGAEVEFLPPRKLPRAPRAR